MLFFRGTLQMTRGLCMFLFFFTLHMTWECPSFFGVCPTTRMTSAGTIQLHLLEALFNIFLCISVMLFEPRSDLWIGYRWISMNQKELFGIHIYVKRLFSKGFPWMKVMVCFERFSC